MTGLPSEAAVWGEERSSWTQQHELLATCIEVTDAWGRQMVGALAAVNGAKVRLPEPLRIQHPDRQEAERPTGSTPMSVAAFEQQIKKGGEKKP